MTNCKEKVTPTDRYAYFHPRQCSRPAVKDGYCHTHHPDAVAKRRAKSDAKFDYSMRKTRWEWEDRRLQNAVVEAVLLWRGGEIPLSHVEDAGAELFKHRQNKPVGVV